MIEFDCDEKLVRGPKGEWSNYFKGVSYFYLPNMPEGHIGYDAVYLSNVTIGGGISSSAAVEVCSFFGVSSRCLWDSSSSVAWESSWTRRIVPCEATTQSTSLSRCRAA